MENYVKDFSNWFNEAKKEIETKAKQQLLESLQELPSMKEEKHRVFECDGGSYEDFCTKDDCSSYQRKLEVTRNNLRKEIKDEFLALIQSKKNNL